MNDARRTARPYGPCAFTTVFTVSECRQQWLRRTGKSSKHDGAPEAPRLRQLVGLANVDAVNGSVEAREPAFGLGADVLLVLQTLMRAGVDSEDDQ